MATKDLQTLNLKFYQFKSCLTALFSLGKEILKWRLVFSLSILKNILESYLDIYLFKISYDQKYENCDNLGL